MPENMLQNVCYASYITIDIDQIKINKPISKDF